MIYSIFTDYHLFAPNALCTHAEFISLVFKEKQTPGVRLVYLGDNGDRANCTKDKVAWVTEFLRKMIASGLWFIFLFGNHEREEFLNNVVPKFKAVRGVLFDHGDFRFWGIEKALKYRRKSHGAGFLKRGLVVKGIEMFEKNFESNINEDFVSNAISLMKNNSCHTYVCGHKHPDKTTIIKRGAHTIIVLARGLTRLEVDEEVGIVRVLSEDVIYG